MKILYDHQMFGLQKLGGITRYFVELMTHLPDSYKFKNSIVFSDNIYLREADKQLNKGIRIPRFKGAGRFVTLINRLNSIADLSMGRYNVFHPTYYNPYFIKRVKSPYVVTVHDMIHEKFQESYPSDDTTIRYKELTIRNADHIIAISHNTKKDIMECYGIDESRISVVYHGYGNNAGTDTIAGVPSKYILFVGERGIYKNFTRFLKAFAIVHKSIPDVHLICTGSKFTADESSLIKALNVSDFAHSMFVSDAQLNYLYQNAACFVYPSLYEGFGIPILEAFAGKCPVALSNASCFPEVAKDGGLYFDPCEEESIAESLLLILTDTKLRDRLIEKGTEVLKNYSWSKMALETMAIYKQLV